MKPPEAYSPSAIRAGLRTMILGRRIDLHEQAGSTNDLVRQAAKRGEPEGLAIVANEQVAGRGRLGRSWVAPPGCCVLCSVLLRPRFSPQQAFYLTVAASLAIQRACASLFVRVPIAGVAPPLPDHPGNPQVTIKWPNDVLVRGRKVAGILSESEFDGDDWDFSVVGFGVNANLRPEDLGDLRASATSLSIETGHPVDRAALLASVLNEMEPIYLSLQSGQAGFVHSQWVSALETIGKRVSVREQGGVVRGQAVRVDPDGALVVREDGKGERRILAGDVGEV